MYWSLKHWIYFTPVQALLLNSFFEISIYISCCTWSEVCMILAFPPHPFAYFRLFASISCELQLSTYRELTAQSKVQYIQPVYYSHLSTSQKFSIGLYFLQCWPVYSGHPASNNHLAISQEWPLYTGLTVCTVCALNVALWYQNWDQKPFRLISDRNVFIRVYTVALYVFIVVQGHITVEWSSATLQLLDWKHKSTGCTKSNSHWTANFDGRGYEVSNDSCCLVIVSCSWLVMVMILVSPRSWVHWSGVKPQSQFR